MKILILTLTIFISGVSFAQPGFPDFSFGSNGVAYGPFTTDFNQNFAVFQQSDGKLLTAGTIAAGVYEDFFMLRYNTDGTLDSTFGTNGSVTSSLSPKEDEGFAIAQQNDGKILLVGAYDNPDNRDVFIRRYFLNGTLDTTFANGGMVTTDFLIGSDDSANRIKIQSDGKIIVGGTFEDTTNYYHDAMLIRYNADGSLDSTFGSGGKVSYGLSNIDETFLQIDIQADGKIVGVGATDDGLGYWDVLAVRFLPDGTLDSSFNADGIFTFDMNGDDDVGYSLSIQPDGKIVIGGMTYINDEDDLLIRLDSAGYPDTSFNSTGIFTNDFLHSDNHIGIVLIQPDGKIVTVGELFFNFDQIVISRYLSNGSIDSAFFSTSPMIGNGYSLVYDAILQSDNKIVVTGSYETSLGEDIYTSRYLNDSLVNSVNDFFVDRAGIYPNPASGRIYLNNVTYGSEIKIYDSQGQVVYSGKPESNSIDVSSLSPGIYLLYTLNADKQSVIGKFIKQD